MSKTLSAKYHQGNKETPQKKQFAKDIKICLKKKKKDDNMILNITKISQRIKSKSLSSSEKKFIESETSNDLEILKVYIKTDEKLYIYTKRFILRKSKKV